MTERFRVVEGKVMRTEKTEKPSGTWFLYHLWRVGKPVAFGFDAGARVGDRLSIQIEEGAAWLFPGHRYPAITRREQEIFSVDEKLFKDGYGKAAMLAEPIVRWFEAGHATWTPDDSYSDIRKLSPGNSPNICALPVRFLVKRGFMHFTGGFKKCERPNGHSRNLRVYERTLQSRGGDAIDGGDC